MRSRPCRGMTLIELLIVVVILGVLATAALPRFGLAFERARVDEACAALRSIWHAQRMYWLERGHYCDDLRDLAGLRLVDAALVELTEPFAFHVSDSSRSTFSARAVRNDSEWWTGEFAIEETGTIAGMVRNGDGDSVSPPKR